MSEGLWGGPRRPDVHELAREVGRLRQQLAAHERDHETAERVREQTARDRERGRRATRRYWVTTIATVIGSNLATLVVLAVTHHA